MPGNVVFASLLAIGAASLGSLASADVLNTGTDQFLSLCKSQEDMCENYVASDIESVVTADPEDVCLPKDEDDPTITRKIVGWIWRHPDEYGKDTIHSITDAVYDLWGCPAQ